MGNRQAVKTSVRQKLNRLAARRLRMGRMVLAMAGLLTVLAVSALADYRYYVWTYQWQTMPQGELELEWYFDHNIADLEDAGAGSSQHQIELEYGLTDRLDLAVYGVFKDRHDSNDTDYDLTKVKLRSRYRFLEENQFLMNPLLYLEYQRTVDGSDEDIGEIKLILDRTVGDFDCALNFVWEGPLDGQGQDEWKALAAVGYRIGADWHVGIEARSTWEGDQSKWLAGPTVATMLTERLWLAAGIGFGINDEARDCEIRTIVGFYF